MGVLAWGKSDSEAIITPARTQIAQARAAAASLLAERIVVPPEMSHPYWCCSELQHQIQIKPFFVNGIPGDDER